MKKFMFMFLFVPIIFTTVTNAKEKKNSEILYTVKNLNVVLVNSNSQSEAYLFGIGSNQCKNKQFCLIWFFNNKAQAMVGVDKAMSGNIWDPIPGLIGIFSKNKVINKLICYDLAGEEC